jgi:hypothetical protein
MKRITIYQKESETIELLDDDNSDLLLYAQNLSSTLENCNNTVILETSSECLILKPSKISSIKISSEQNNEIIGTKKIEDNVITDEEI